MVASVAASDVPDIRKSLTVLRGEWETCTKCELGEKRQEVGGAFVFGEGTLGGVMFIGEGPGINEEKEGRPFVGESGQLLRDAIKQANIDRYYISNVVSCRSCGVAYDNAGQPRIKKNYRTGELEPRIVDKPPTPTQLQACLPRLFEEIYLVDPMLIVGLGAEACKVLQGGKAITVTRETGIERHIEIPGASFNPNLTAKKGVWARKVRGELKMPVDQNMVRYLMIPIIHPAYVLRLISDERHGSPLHDFAKSMSKVADVYHRILQEVHSGHHPGPKEYLQP